MLPLVLLGALPNNQHSKVLLGNLKITCGNSIILHFLSREEIRQQPSVTHGTTSKEVSQEFTNLIFEKSHKIQLQIMQDISVLIRFGQYQLL